MEEEGNVSEVPTTLAANQESSNETDSLARETNVEKVDIDISEEGNEAGSTLLKESAPITESLSLTTAPNIEDTQFTTTSIVTTTGTESSSKGRQRAISKIDAANEFVYGHVEESWIRPDLGPSTDLTVTFRPNRAQTMRQSCIMKRALTEEREKSRKEEIQSSVREPEIVDPVSARPIPKFIRADPKIRIKDTKSSKFRYLYNRKPPGVKVYFKRANADEKKKPPFVVSTHT